MDRCQVFCASCLSHTSQITTISANHMRFTSPFCPITSLVFIFFWGHTQSKISTMGWKAVESEEHESSSPAVQAHFHAVRAEEALRRDDVRAALHLLSTTHSLPSPITPYCSLGPPFSMSRRRRRAIWPARSSSRRPSGSPTDGPSMRSCYWLKTTSTGPSWPAPGTHGPRRTKRSRRRSRPKLTRRQSSRRTRK